MNQLEASARKVTQLENSVIKRARGRTKKILGEIIEKEYALWFD